MIPLIEEWFNHPLIQTAWQILFAILIYFIVRAIGRKLISKAFQRPRAKESSVARVQTLEKLLLNVFSYVLFFIIAFNILESLGFHLGPLLAAAGVVGLAIGFGAQLVSDVVTGFFLILERQLEVGDYVSAGSVNGIVEELGFRTTQIRAFDGTLHYIPNRNITNVDNHSRGNMRALVDLTIPANDKNTEETIAMVHEALETFTHPALISNPEVVGVLSDDLSTTVIRVIAKTENMQQWAVERDIRKAIRMHHETLKND
ncbi:LOW QUALITY PROTEIN: potassium efflux system KefA protein [Bacillus sp. JCM 19046]|nr:LOW QUALITY PROTEIN: potassium efflux system KefA protein [Bacillus sp. JCM 19046]